MAHSLWVKHGLTLRKLVKYEEAIESFEKALEFTKNNEEVKKLIEETRKMREA